MLNQTKGLGTRPKLAEQAHLPRARARLGLGHTPQMS